MKPELYRCGQSTIEDLTDIPGAGAYLIRSHVGQIPGTYDWFCTIRRTVGDECEVVGVKRGPNPRETAEALHLFHKVGYRVAYFECVHTDGRITQTRCRTRLKKEQQECNS
jgi:hypothetical protein